MSAVTTAKERSVPQWIWHEQREGQLQTTISKVFELHEQWTDVALYAAFTGAAAIRLNGKQISIVAEDANNAAAFQKLEDFPSVLPAGQYMLEIEMNCSAIVPIVSVNKYLWQRRVGLIAYLSAADGWLATDNSWSADDRPAAVICRLGEEPFGELAASPEWFVKGGYGDIAAYPITELQSLAVSKMTVDLADGRLTAQGELQGDYDLPQPKAKQLELFYHLRKQNEWKEMRRVQQALDCQRLPSCTLDLYKEYNTRLVVANRGTVPVKLLWNGGESLHELEHYDGQITEWFEVGPGETFWTLPQGLRYVRCYFLGRAGEQFQLSIRFESVHVELNQIGTIETTPPLLGQIYDTSAHTSKICHQTGLWDGIKRDRLNWTFDFYLAARSGYYLWDDYAALQRAVRELGVGTPYGEWMNSICEYTLWWIKAVCEYYFYTGDKSFVLEMKEPLARHISWVEANIDQESGGLVIDKWVLIEWAPLTDEEKHTALQAILKLTRKDVERLVAAVPELDITYNWPLPQLDEAAFMAESHQLATKTLGIISNYVSEEKALAFLQSYELRDPYTPLSAFTLAECYSKFGMHDRAYEVIAHVWGGMIERGATTFWESYTQDIEGSNDFHDALTTYSGYKSYRISLCHAWSSTPVKWMTEYVLGVQPLEAGFGKIRFAPHAAGKLTACQGTVNTPYGPIAVSWKVNSSGELKADLQVPAGITVLRD
ncbi:alpha-L-rhamnosidase C-terminal domain-containing protein [Paenibacillus sp. GCM10027626]|uniref:alpha-L-rhamnosidase C-terminal domain-containing protein n=1 Tax=Paenibacillus sp. GCM10027626 TaxID=3273411 RepID=UPI003635217C